MISILKAEPLSDLHLRLTFDDGTVKVIDIEALVNGSAFEASLKNPQIFQAVKLYPRGRGVWWPNDFDLCPDMLRDSASV